MYKITISYWSRQQSTIKNITSLSEAQSMLIKLCQTEDIIGVPQLALQTDKDSEKREYI